MAANGRFRTSVFGGYNCNDVITFITEENRRFQSAKAALEEEISALKEANAALSDRIAGAEEARDSLRAAAESAEELRRRAEGAETALEAKENLLSAVLSENAELKAHLAELEQKFGELSRACEDLGAEKQYLVDLEIAARRRADAVTEESEKRVELISATVRDRVDSAAGLLGRFSEEADRKVAGALAAMNEYMEMLRVLNGTFADTRREMLAAVEEIRTAGLPAPGEKAEEND